MASLRNLALFLGALLPAAAASADTVPGKYIVTLRDGIDVADATSHMDWVGEVHRRSLGARSDGSSGVKKTFSIDAFNAYSGEFDAATLEEIKANPDVLEVEEVQIYTLAGVMKRDIVTQEGATWGLNAISHRDGENGSDYTYDDSAGEGTFGYVIDSGCRVSHDEFEGRAVAGYNAFDGAADDDKSVPHGTHVAGTIAGLTVGVAKKASIVSVKVFDESDRTTTEEILDGLAWSVNDILDKGRQNKAVINMSLRGGKSEAMNRAIATAFEKGILTVAASGNSNWPAGEGSPSSAPEAITVASIDPSWQRSTFSDYGPEVDIFAPGRDVKSAWPTADNAYGSLTGTSHAAPHVAGVALYLLALEGGDAASVTKRILELATKDRLPDTKGSENLVLYNGSGA